MHAATLNISACFLRAASVFLLPFPCSAEETQFSDATDCRMQWDGEFDHYIKQYQQCGPECWSADQQHREYRRFSEWLRSLKEWRAYCQAMSGTERQLHNPDAPRSSPAARTWPVVLNTDGQSSCELIRSGEVRYRFHWKDRRGNICYSNSGHRKTAAACCPS